MKVLLITVLLVATLSYAAWARPNGAYSINVHFVPAIHQGECQAGTFWSPTDVKCARCLCIANRFSRCGPQPGCSPFSTTAKPTTGNSGPTTKPTTESSGPTKNPEENKDPAPTTGSPEPSGAF